MKYFIKEVKVTEEEIDREVEFLQQDRGMAVGRIADIDKRLAELTNSKGKLKEE